MKTITLKKAVELLEMAAAVILPDESGRLVYPSVDFLNDGDNPFFYVAWEEDGQEFRIQAFERDNETVSVDNAFLYLIDEDGETLKIQLLEPMILI